MLKRWTVFARFLDDGRICLTNNAHQTGANAKERVRSMAPAHGGLAIKVNALMDANALPSLPKITGCQAHD